jgi:hypothetical protein
VETSPWFVLESRPAQAKLVDVVGRVRQGIFFLRSGGAPAHVESLFDLLNDDELHFLPFESDDGIELIAVESIAYVEFELPERQVRSLEEAGAVHTPIEIEVLGGERLAADLMHGAPPSVRRISDLLNVLRERFLTLLSGDRAWAVRRRAILRACPRDAGAGAAGGEG